MYRHNRLMLILSVSLSLVIVGAFFLLVSPRPPLRAAIDLDEGLVSSWEFEEGSGTETYSAVAGSSRYTGTMTAGVTWTTDVPITSTGSHSIRFDGQQWTVLATNQFPTDLYTMTISLWFKSEPGNEGRWISLARTRRTSGAGGRGLMLGMGPLPTGGWGDWGKDRTVYFIVDGHAEVCGVYAPNFVIPEGEWHHIVGVWGAHLGGDTSSNPVVRPNQFRIYIDGNLQELVGIPFGCGSTPVNDVGGARLTFGDALDHYRTNNTPFGLLDDVRTYYRVLSDEEIFALSGRRVTGVQIQGAKVGDMFEPYEFKASFLPGAVTLPFTYTWSATDGFEQESNRSTATIGWRSAGKKTITVVARGALGVFTGTHTIDIQPVNLQLRLDGPVSPHPVLTSAFFTATLSPKLRTKPVTYTWEATDHDPVIHEPERSPSQEWMSFTRSMSFTWNTRGTKTVTVTARNEFFTRTQAMTIQVFAVDPKDILTNLPEVVEYERSYGGLYIATRPMSVTRPFTYTWDWSKPSLVVAAKPRPFHHPISANDPLTSSNHITFTWKPATPLVRGHDTHIMTTTVWSAGGGSYTKTHAIQATYRPFIEGITQSNSVPDQRIIEGFPNQRTAEPIPTQRIFEDDALTITFTTIDTDTLGTLTHSTPSSGNTDIVPTSNIVVGKPKQRNTTNPNHPDYLRFDSTVTITPTANRWGKSSITLFASDGLLEGEKSFNLEVIPVNDAPSFSLSRTTLITDEDSGPQVVHHWARDITAGPYEDKVQKVNFTLEVGVEGGYDPREFFAVLPTLSPTGTLRFTTARHVHGTAIITATLKDNGGLAYPERKPKDTSEPRTFRIVIRPVNDPPKAASATYTIDENQTLIITDTLLLSRATDVDTDPKKPLWYDERDVLSLHAVARPRNGTTALLTNSSVPTRTFQYLRYIPKRYFHGTDTFTYTIRDRPGATSVGTVTVIINPVNDPPVAADLLFTTNEDTPLVITATQILSRAADPDDDKLMLATGALLNETIPPASVQNGTVQQTADRIRYIPPEHFHGTDAFAYMISDGVFTDTARITVTVLSVNDPPSFTAGKSPIAVTSRSRPVSSNLPAWATQMLAGPPDEQETQTLAFSLTNDRPHLFTQQPSIDAATGDLAFTIAGNRVQGSVTVSATLKDDGGTERGGIDRITRTFTIEITPNRAPLAKTNTFETAYRTPIDIPITELGSDPEGDEILFERVSGMQPSSGTFTLSDDRKTIRFVPADKFSGEARFSFAITDGDLRDDRGQATVIVQELRIRYVYLPLVLKHGRPDLAVKSISITPDRSQTGHQYTAGEPVTITIEVENIGDGTAKPFWVDLFINPASPPTQPNTDWSTLCTLDPCFGITWGVKDALEPGESVVLRSIPGSYGYMEGNGIQLPVWKGWFASGTNALYVYVDSWNNDDPISGGVIEANERNNITNLVISVTGVNPSATSRGAKTTVVDSPNRWDRFDPWFRLLPNRLSVGQ